MAPGRLTRCIRWLLAAAAVVVGTAQPAVADEATARPGAPTSVAIAQIGLSNELRVSWAPAANGSPASDFLVVLFDTEVKGPVAVTTCYAGCTAQTFRQLTFGHKYGVVMGAENSAGASPGVWSSALTLGRGCPGIGCVLINATRPIEPAAHQAAGLLYSVGPSSAISADLAALRTTMWRSTPVGPDGSYDWDSWDVAQAAGVPTTLVLSDLWGWPGHRSTPWSNWLVYSQWVGSTVQRVLASGRRVDYWEIQNEPGGKDYYSAADFAASTPHDYLEQFLVAYDAIKAVDPTARVIGPSLEHWSDRPGEYGSHEFDMATFLNFAAANRMQLAAISWHEIDDFLSPSENTLNPAKIGDHVAEARRLMATLPALGSPKIFINEFGMPEVNTIPGWDVAYLAALTNAKVDSAGRSCWVYECANPTLDGLLSYDGHTPLADFYVRQAYGGMAGAMVSASTTDDHLSALASFDPSTKTMRALVGRASGCTQTAWCRAVWPWAKPSGPRPVTVAVTLPWRSGGVTVTPTRIAGGALSAAVPRQGKPFAIRLSGGVATFSLPALGDGDAYAVTITR